MDNNPFINDTSGKSFNTSTNHPIIPNSQEYLYFKKYVSIHSDDRDYTKYPQSSKFEIELPEDYTNVVSVKLSDWKFPFDYSNFSYLNSNVTMMFKVNLPYNPGEHSFSDTLQNAIFVALYNNIQNDYVIVIEDGYYNSSQMAKELTNKFNNAVSNYIINYFDENGYSSLIPEFEASGLYSQFVIVYNEVGQHLWFGNRSSGFVITNESLALNNLLVEQNNINCIRRSKLPEFSNWGLPAYLGFTRCNHRSFTGEVTQPISGVVFNGRPRFFYGDVETGDDGYWLNPDPSLPGSQVYWLQAIFKLNLLGEESFYMEIEGLNIIDETSPYNLSTYTLEHNQTNSRVNSAFAKIAIPTSTLSSFIDKDSKAYKYWNPPAERIRKLKIKLRYHNGQAVNFGPFGYTFTLEFTVYTPQQLKKYRIFDPNSGTYT